MTKFLKDTQIISAKTDMRKFELEIIQSLRKLRPSDYDYRPGVLISFSEFIQLLDPLSMLVYPNNQPDEALR